MFPNVIRFSETRSCGWKYGSSTSGVIPINMSFRSAFDLIEKIASKVGLIPIEFDFSSNSYVESVQMKIRFLLRSVTFNVLMMVLMVVSWDMRTIDSHSIIILHLARIFPQAAWCLFDITHFLSLCVDNRRFVKYMNRLLRITECYLARRVLPRHCNRIARSNQIILLGLLIYFGPFILILYIHAFNYRIEVPLLMNYLVFNSHIIFLCIDCVFMLTGLKILYISLRSIRRCMLLQKQFKPSKMYKLFTAYTELCEILDFVGSICGKQAISLHFLVLTLFSSILFFSLTLLIDHGLIANGFVNVIVYVVFLNFPILIILVVVKTLSDAQYEVSVPLINYLSSVLLPNFLQESNQSKGFD